MLTISRKLMNLRSIVKYLIWKYQKSRLGAIGINSNVSILASILGNRKQLYLGKEITICKHATLEIDPTDPDRSQIIIGDNTLISSFAMIRTYGGKIEIGHSSFINSFTVLYGHGDLKIGNGCLIGPQVTIVPVNYGFQDRKIPFREQTPSVKGITIEDDVWIGAGATILDGCTIGTGAVIGAGAVVTKSVEPYAIVAGIPARKLGMRS
jgi:acetyltransferase-like isoleucine patch superfamily enzyme